ncbi:glycosyltransferase family 2 protein [Sphingomonas sp. JC676]|uniref:glycosyltransferase family 2 protein n=1 Tax=Sphingomonas sp. JC676 TaxID=2768065 RepID=UPI001657E4DE|nr:glycosyltransferase family 2 protein [Sphingomonas sp. JC676]MBC9031390.1 glycosyltransferase family 2 protein [Sphingomonas sp. JC676]
MTGRSDTLVSVLVPVLNEAANVGRAYAEITRVFDNLPGYACEIIFTDNHSTDATFSLLRAIAHTDPRVRVIRFARNIGYQRSLLVAYQNARGACSIQIDCDLQDPPNLIPRMLAMWREGHQVVYGVRRSLAESRVKATMRRWFYYGINALSEDDLPLNAGEFRLVDGRLLEELRTVQDTSPYLRGLISSMGFSQVGFEYDRGARIAGESKFPLGKMLGLAADGILNHSLVPLRVASAVGLVVGTSTTLLIVIYLAGRLAFGQQWPAGFATTTMLLLLSITLNALFLGVIGEYLGRIFMQVKRRPVPIIEARLNDIPAPVSPARPRPRAVPRNPKREEQVEAAE